MYDSDVGALTIDLVSLTAAPIDFPLSPSTMLQVSAPTERNVEVHVRAVGRPPRTYYRMDAVLPPGGTLAWPVTDVLVPERLSADRIGLWGWKGSERSPVLVPVVVAVRGSRVPSGAPALWVRPSFDTQAVKWRSSPAAGAVCARFDGWKDAAGSVTAGDSLPISLSGLKGPLCLEIAASSTSQNDWATLKLRIDLTP